MKTHPEVDGPCPACFTNEQWANWVKCERQMVRLGQYVHNPSGFCAECTPGHQEKMIAAGRCSHPLVRFQPDEDGYVVGVRPLRELVIDGCTK